MAYIENGKFQDSLIPRDLSYCSRTLLMTVAGVYFFRDPGYGQRMDRIAKRDNTGVITLSPITRDPLLFLSWDHIGADTVTAQRARVLIAASPNAAEAAADFISRHSGEIFIGYSQVVNGEVVHTLKMGAEAARFLVQFMPDGRYNPQSKIIGDALQEWLDKRKAVLEDYSLGNLRAAGYTFKRHRKQKNQKNK